MIAVDCDYDDGAPITYRGIALQRDGIEVARFAENGFDADLSAAIAHSCAPGAQSGQYVSVSRCPGGPPRTGIV
jgi:hypothetical protein